MIASAGNDGENGERGAWETSFRPHIPSFVGHRSRDGRAGVSGLRMSASGPAGRPARSGTGIWFPRRASTFLYNAGPARA